MEMLIVFLIGLFIVYRIFRFATRDNNKEYRRIITYGSYNPKPKVFRQSMLEADGLEGDFPGMRSEQDIINSLIDYGISARAIFHNLIFKSGKGKSTQIDVVVATRVGLVVFEIKDYSGWIFGKGKEDKWTQSLKYGWRYKQSKKYRFYNPVLQNESHIKVLKRQSQQFQKLPFYSVIVFDGNCELHDISFIPHGTYVIKPHRLHDVLDKIFENADAEYTDKHEIMRILQSAVDNGNSAENQIKHVENIKDMLGKDRVLD